jgi:hypothetical protein
VEVVGQQERIVARRDQPFQEPDNETGGGEMQDVKCTADFSILKWSSPRSSESWNFCEATWGYNGVAGGWS